MRYGQRRQRGVVKIDEIVFEKGKYPIKLDKNSATFIVLIAGKELTDKNLDELKKKALALLKESSRDRDWEAIIQIDLEKRHWGVSDYRFSAERYFRCKLPNGSWLFRHFRGDDEIDSPEDLKAHLGEPKRMNARDYPREEYIYIPYSAEAWKGCIAINRFEAMVSKLVFETLSKASKKKLPDKLREMARTQVALVVKPKKKGKK